MKTDILSKLEMLSFILIPTYIKEQPLRTLKTLVTSICITHQTKHIPLIN